MQVRDRGASRCCLRGTLLGFAKLSDRDGQGNEVGDKRGRDQGGVAGDPAGQRHQPGRGA